MNIFIAGSCCPVQRWESVSQGVRLTLSNTFRVEGERGGYRHSCPEIDMFCPTHKGCPCMDQE